MRRRTCTGDHSAATDKHLSSCIVNSDTGDDDGGDESCGRCDIIREASAIATVDKTYYCHVVLVIGAICGGVFLGVLLGIAVSAKCGVVEVPSSGFRLGHIEILSPKSENNALPIVVRSPRERILASGAIGMGVPNAVGNPTSCTSDEPDTNCREWGDFARIEMKVGSTRDCLRIESSSTYARELEDCYDLDPAVHWYGGGETHTQTWPIESNKRQLSPFVTGDFLQSADYFYGGVVENYFLLSGGAAIKIDDETPLYISVNTTRPNQICFLARDHSPYTKRDKLVLGYEWCVGNNLKEVHQQAISTFYSKPDQIPDERMLIQPFWSTWAEYKEAVNQSIVLDYARKVMAAGFVNSSHIEIDDHWETCYGEEEFNPVKFPDPKAMMDDIKSMNNMRVTAWVHLFINEGCPKYQEAVDNGYFVQSTKPRTGITWWWQGRQNAGIIDMTNPEAKAWWIARLQKLQQETGLTSFKFDAGEVNWLPASPNLNNATNSNLWPQQYTTSYVDTCAEFGGLIETRVAHLNQKQPIFIRMLDKDSRWGYDNGLQPMIPTLLHFGIVGYPFVLPDMIGGNAYGDETPSQELYVRWMQVNIFMPAVQFSLAPWNIGEEDQDKAETVRMCLRVLEDREKHAEHIMAAARQATVDGSPINRPIWWADPDNLETHVIDDEYMLGNTIVVAPVVKEGETSRDIFLPTGRWTAGTDSQTHTGPIWLRNYPAPLDVVPFFVKAD